MSHIKQHENVTQLTVSDHRWKHNQTSRHRHDMTWHQRSNNIDATEANDERVTPLKGSVLLFYEWRTRRGEDPDNKSRSRLAVSGRSNGRARKLALFAGPHVHCSLSVWSWLVLRSGSLVLFCSQKMMFRKNRRSPGDLYKWESCSKFPSFRRISKKRLPVQAKFFMHLWERKYLYFSHKKQT